MRIVGAFLACLLAGTALAQSVSKPAQPATAQPVVQPIDPSAAPPVTQAALAPAAEPAAKIIEPAATAPATQPAEAPAPDVKPAEQAIAVPVAEPAAANPAEQAATPPGASPAQVPAAEPAVTPVKQAVATPTEPVEPAAPAAKPAEPSAAPPAAEPAAKTEAATCPGHPDALGTSRVLTITPAEFQLLGTIDYKQTLPLKDHEVVLTFDDGPIPPYTNSVLDTLAANCVKATYFLVGEMAAPRPYLVRRIYNEGHSIGTHSQHHPFAFQRLSMQRVEREVDGGIASVATALGDPKALSPFFRIPGFGRTNAIDHYLENKGLVTWSADIDTDDWWRGTTPGVLVQRAMRRLNAKGRGIILMHDIHPATALALPTLLKELKAGGYHVVQVVAAGERPNSLPEVVATPLEKEIWPGLLHAKSEKGGAAMSALRHRVKRVLAGRSSRHHRYRHTRTARVESAPKTHDLSAAQ